MIIAEHDDGVCCARRRLGAPRWNDMRSNKLRVNWSEPNDTGGSNSFTFEPAVPKFR